MSSSGFKIDVAKPVNDILASIANIIQVKVDQLINHKSFSQPNGGQWYSGVVDGVVFSAYYHATRRHRTSVKPGANASTFPSEKCWVDGGNWANAAGGNHAYFDTE
jgi:hypothetical protein